MIVRRQTFEGTRSPCKQGARVAVAAVRAGAEDDGVRGECLLAYSPVLFPTLLLFSQPFPPELLLQPSSTTARASHRCPNKDRSTMILFRHLFMCFPFALPLGLKSKPLTFCCYYSSSSSWICLRCAESRPTSGRHVRGGLLWNSLKF